MLTHIVLFKLKDRSPQSVARAADVLRSLQGNVPNLRALEVGVNIVPADRAYDIALLARFDSVAALQEYQAHPNHVRVSDYMRSVAESTVAVDYEL
jgi:Stress responsive A/B Barrel Domain.